MPPIMQWFEKMRDGGGKLIVVDPRETPTAPNADYFLQITPSTDLVLANGLLHIAIEEGLLDCDFIAARTNDFERARRAVASYWPARVERLTGVSEETLREITRILASGNSMILSARGSEQHANGTDTTLGFINLALGLGSVSRIPMAAPSSTTCVSAVCPKNPAPNFPCFSPRAASCRSIKAAPKPAASKA